MKIEERIKGIRNQKHFVILVSILVGFLLLYLSFDAINEVKDWEWFSLDFDKKDHIISAYGTLLAGLLAFVSILFVIYGLLQQKIELLQERLDESKLKAERNEEHIQLIRIMLEPVLIDIGQLGGKLLSFIKDEEATPLSTHKLRFYSLGNFKRLLELDIERSYNAFMQKFDSNDWGEKFIDYNNHIDFYFEMLAELRLKYQDYEKDKVNLLKEVQAEFDSLIKKCGDSILKSREGESETLNKTYILFMNNIAKYNMDSEKKKVNPSLDHISDVFLTNLINDMYSIGLDSFDDEQDYKLFHFASNLKGKLERIKNESKNYVLGLQDHHKAYFETTSSGYKNISDLIKQIKKN